MKVSSAFISLLTFEVKLFKEVLTIVKSRPPWVIRYGKHCWYIEPRNREKSLRLIWQRFSCLLDEWIAKISKKKFFSRWLFEIIHIIRFEIWDLRSRDLKKVLGYDINYLSIWPFMRHPWFPTRKASKLRSPSNLKTVTWSSTSKLKTGKS